MLALLFFVITTLAGPYVRSLSLGEDLRFEEDTEGVVSTFSETVSSEGEEYAPPPVRHRASNSTVTSGPGSLCHRQSDCDDSLVCQASSTCECPDITPVLILEEDGFACVAPRRLSESCQRDAECAYGDNHAQCVESPCGCQSLFYDPGDGSRCLPVVMTRHGLKTTLLSSALLIVAFIVLAILGYQRLHKHQDDKSRQACEIPQAIESSTPSAGDWFSARLKCTSVENDDRATSKVSTWMRAIATNLHAAKHRLQSPWWHRRRVPSYAEHDSQCTTDRTSRLMHYSTWSNNRDHASRILLAMPSATARSVSSGEHLTPSEARRQKTEDASRSVDQCSKETIPVTKRPVQNRSGRPSAVLTNTLIPSHRASRRRDFNSSKSTSTLIPFYSQRPHSINSGVSSLRYETVEENANQFNDRPTLQTRITELAIFTKSELQAGTPKKFNSARVAAPDAKRLRRALSQYHDPLSGIFKRNTEHVPCRCPCHGCSNVQFGASSINSSSTAISWDTESCAKSLTNERSKRGSPDLVFTRSQLTWPCKHAQPVVPDRRVRTCETFVVRNVRPRPKVTRQRNMPPVERRTPRTPLTFGRFHASGDEPDYWRSVGARRRLSNIGARSDIAASSSPQASSFSARSATLRSGYGIAGRSGQSRCPRSSTRGRSPSGRAYPRARAAQRASQVPCFNRGLQAMDSALNVAALDAESNGSDDWYSSFSFSRSDCSNLPLSVTTLRTGRTGMSRESDGSSARS